GDAVVTDADSFAGSIKTIDRQKRFANRQCRLQPNIAGHLETYDARALLLHRPTQGTGLRTIRMIVKPRDIQDLPTLSAERLRAKTFCRVVHCRTGRTRRQAQQESEQQIDDVLHDWARKRLALAVSRSVS